MGETKPTSDEAIRKTTWLSWEEWGEAPGARELSHGEIVKWLVTERNVGNWWAQTVTVEYERARGLRTGGSGRDGLYTVSASKTVDASAEKLFRVSGCARAGCRTVCSPNGPRNRIAQPGSTGAPKSPESTSDLSTRGHRLRSRSPTSS